MRKGGWAAEPGRRGVAGAHQRRESVARSAFGPAGGCSGRREALFANPRRGCAGDMVPRQSARQAVAHRIMALGRSAALAVARPMPYRQEGALRHINQGVDFANLSWPGKIRPASPPPAKRVRAARLCFAVWSQPGTRAVFPHLCQPLSLGGAARAAGQSGWTRERQSRSHWQPTSVAQPAARRHSGLNHMHTGAGHLATAQTPGLNRRLCSPALHRKLAAGAWRVRV